MSWNAPPERTMPPRFTGRPQAAKPTLCLRVAAIAKITPKMLPIVASSPAEPCDNPLHPLCCVLKSACAINRCGCPSRLNPHRSRKLPAVSFFEGFQTPAGLQKTSAHSCGRHLKPITIADWAWIQGTAALHSAAESPD